MLAFGGTRTFHRLACNIEDAGFEVRDCCMWLYGSGFPKSQDISKAIDKQAGQKRKVIGVKPGHGEFANRTTKGHIDFKDGTDGFDRPWMHDDEARKQYHLATAPATPEAEKWQGWGTALKPAWEPIIVARKPVVGTVAENALKYGTGGLNIDGCRISGAPRATGTVNPHEVSGVNGIYGMDKRKMRQQEYDANLPLGRWPANILLDEGSGEMLDGQTGELSFCGSPKKTSSNGGLYQMGSAGAPGTIYRDRGGASRFFYCAKASKSERNVGIKSGVNGHPTVKPLSLNKYLAKLICPPENGRTRKLIVPFCGSGSEMIGALKSGWDKVCGIEKESDYVDIAAKRLRHWNKCSVDVYDWE